ncbi:hypothetical protein F4604DRAFT_1919304 [Suillus subluteus]|nr:hypothetical protein F4604DRAFT_1919304 [Suillus subluteus]
MASPLNLSPHAYLPLCRGYLKQQEDVCELHASLLKKLPLKEHERLLDTESNQNRPGSSSATPSNTFDFLAYDIDIDAMLPPPGEEGFTVSHAGMKSPFIKN